MCFAFIGQHIDFNLLQQTAQQFLSVPGRRGRRVPNPFQIAPQGTNLFPLQVGKLQSLFLLFTRQFGFRPGRNCHQALEQVLKLHEEGYRVVLDADIKGFLDPYSYYTLAAEVWSKSWGWLSKTRMRKPFCLPRLTWTTESSPRFTRCMIVWRDTPRMRMAWGMAT